MLRELKIAIYNRVKGEHESYDSGTDGAEANDWWHKEGSAKAYIGDYGGTAAFVGPTTRPDGVTSLSADDAGRICIDTNGGNNYNMFGLEVLGIGLGGLPIGFPLYIQLAGMAAPSTIFPVGTWTNISTYAGRFFQGRGWEMPLRLVILLHRHSKQMIINLIPILQQGVQGIEQIVGFYRILL